MYGITRQVKFTLSQQNTAVADGILSFLGLALIKPPNRGGIVRYF